MGGPSSPLTDEALEAFSDVFPDAVVEPALSLEVAVFLPSARLACRAAFEEETGMLIVSALREKVG